MPFAHLRRHEAGITGDRWTYYLAYCRNAIKQRAVEETQDARGEAS
jgi:hypothetical protein